MNNTNKILISLLAFIVAVALGYLGAGFVKGIVDKPARSRDHSSAVSLKGSGSSGKSSKAAASRGGKVPSKGSSGSIDASADSLLESPAGSPASADTMVNSNLSTSVEILQVTTPVYDEDSELYEFDVTATGIGLIYVLADGSGTELSTQESSHFRVRGSSTGNYSVYAQDINGQKSDPYAITGCYYKVKKISAEELGRILNSKESDNAYKADFKNRVSPSCRYDFQGRNEDEGAPPVSYSDIIMRLKYNTWASVNVLSVYYDDMNKLSKAVIKVNY